MSAEKDLRRVWPHLGHLPPSNLISTRRRHHWSTTSSTQHTCKPSNADPRLLLCHHHQPLNHRHPLPTPTKQMLSPLATIAPSAALCFLLLMYRHCWRRVPKRRRSPVAMLGAAPLSPHFALSPLVDLQQQESRRR
ncbi:unnamed protein product [Lactuca virosa]|uniref:Uncharacterized protein n=1 Tax=Lactuca virosa TaxID=75947 RepID=A0AAU9N4Y9_9ASTR|nr:unnamed protein product [Lactuca virosa]